MEEAEAMETAAALESAAGGRAGAVAMNSCRWGPCDSD